MALPATPRRHSKRTAAAYASLGVAPNDVLLAPKVTPLLQRIVQRGIGLSDGQRSKDSSTLRDVLVYLRASSEPPARKFIRVYDDPTLTTYARRNLPVEAFCLAAGIDPTDILGPITRVAHLHGAMLGAIQAAEKHPEVVRASLDAATQRDAQGNVIGSVEDRMANLKHMGYLPTSKGAVINVNASATANAAAAAKSDSPTLAAPEDTIRRIVEARQRAAMPAAVVPQLPAATAAESDPQAFMPRAAREPQMVEVEGEYEEADE
jgi:hypothetical protein